MQTPAPTIISLNQLMNSVQTLKSVEMRNKQILETLDSEKLIQNLHGWASSGYQDSQSVYEYTLALPAKVQNKYICSDGLYREIWEYIPFCLEYSIGDLVAKIQLQLTDIKVSFSLQEELVVILRIHASR